MSKLAFRMPKMVLNFYEMDALSKIIVGIRSQNANKMKVLEPDLFLDFHSWNEQVAGKMYHCKMILISRVVGPALITR